MGSLLRSHTWPARVVYRVSVFLLAIASTAGRAAAQTTLTLSTPGTHISVDTTIRDGAYASTNYSSSDTLVDNSSVGLRDENLIAPPVVLRP